MSYIHKKLKPPTQYLRGAGFTIPVETALQVFDRYRFRRRVMRVRSGPSGGPDGGVIVSQRAEVVVYETAVTGDVWRIDEDGRRHAIEPGDAFGEFKWAAHALRYRWERTFFPPAFWTAGRPEDLISMYDERTGKWVQEWEKEL